MALTSSPPVLRNRIVGQADVPPGDLVANPNNWRTHPKAQRAALAGALEEVGWVQQILVNTTTGRMVDGHARAEEALRRGEPTVPVLYVELSEAEERTVLATLDPIGALAGRDQAALDALIAEITINDDALSAMLDKLVPRQSKVGLTDPDDAPPLTEKAAIQRGDLFALGDHRLMCADSTNGEDVARLAAGATAECMWTDPPYGVDYVGKTKDALTLENDGHGAGVREAAGAFAVAPLAASARFYVAVPGGPRQVEFLLAVRDAGWRLHQELVWVKSSMVLGHSDYHYRHEPILYGYVPGVGRPGRGAHDGTRWYGDHAETSVLEYDKPSRSEEHPTMKPVGLVEQCLRNSTQAGDVVYDPFVGSGTTIIAADRLGRRCYGLEIDPRYVGVAIARWEAFTGGKARRLDG